MTGTWADVIADVSDRSFRGWIDPGLATRMVREMEERDAIGRARYGVPIAPFNGRDGLQDALEEALDAAVYLRARCSEVEALGVDEFVKRETRMGYDDALGLVGRLMRLKMYEERNPE